MAIEDRETPAEPVDAPETEQAQEQVPEVPQWPEAPRMWTEEELLRGALREHWEPEDTIEEVTDNA